MKYSNSLSKLKNKGHKLLNEYISLDSSHEDKKSKTAKAYRKLADKLESYRIYPHFSLMKTEEEVEIAIMKLEKMIEKRKDKIKYSAKSEYAPNLQELQKNASNLNNQIKTCTHEWKEDEMFESGAITIIEGTVNDSGKITRVKCLKCEVEEFVPKDVLNRFSLLK